MSNQKKQIILNEIAFWKKSKMLPEKYCDYLTMIYTEGNQDVESLHGNASESIKAKEKNNANKVLITTIVVTIALVAALFLIPSVFVVSIIIGIIMLSLIVASFSYLKRNAAFAVALQVAAAVLMLALTVRITSTYFEGNNIALYTGLSINCLFWFLSGWKMKLPYFTFSGILGIVALIGYWLYQF